MPAALFGMMCLFCMKAQAQVKVCMNYADFKADKWKPYTDMIEGKELDSCRVKYDGTDFTFKMSDKEVNKVIKHDVFLMSVDNQLFVNKRMLRDEDGNFLPVNNYLRALPYKDGKLCVVSYKVTLGDVVDLVNIGLDVALLATGHTTWGTIFQATGLLLTYDKLMEHHILYLIDKEPNAKGKIDCLAGLKKILNTTDIETIGMDGRREATPSTMYSVDAPVYNMMGQRVDKSQKGLSSTKVVST